MGHVAHTTMLEECAVEVCLIPSPVSRDVVGVAVDHVASQKERWRGGGADFAEPNADSTFF